MFRGNTWEVQDLGLGITKMAISEIGGVYRLYHPRSACLLAPTLFSAEAQVRKGLLGRLGDSEPTT